MSLTTEPPLQFMYMLLCISFIFCCCDKYPAQKYFKGLRDKGFIRLIIPSYRLQGSQGVKERDTHHSQEQRTNIHVPTSVQLSLHYRSACPGNGATHSGWVFLPQHNQANPTDMPTRGQRDLDSPSETLCPGDSKLRQVDN